jgi:phage shock protein C
MTVCRSAQNRVIAGVCGGWAEHWGWPPFRLRVVWVLGTVFSAAFPGLILYLAFWYLMPKAPPALEPAVLQPWKSST